MYCLTCNWIREGGALLELPELVADLAATTYTFKGERLLLEDESILKQKLGRSPDHSDTLALTLSYPVVGRTAALMRPNHWRGGFEPYRPGDYDPLAGLDDP